MKRIIFPVQSGLGVRNASARTEQNYHSVPSRLGGLATLSIGSRQTIGDVVMSTRSRLQHGVGLIEVLVAVLVLSIAFLGIAALQAMSLSTNNSAMARSMAIIASYSIQDAMRADMANAKAGSYNTTVTADACPVAGNTLATSQLSLWCAELNQRLGSSSTTKGAVLCTATGDCVVTITFDDRRAGVGGTSAQQIKTEGML